MNSVPGDFWEWTASLQSGERVALLFVAVFALVFIVTMLLGTIYKMHKNRLEDALKRELLERGMSADDITKIIEAAAPPEDATQRWIASWAKSKKS